MPSSHAIPSTSFITQLRQLCRQQEANLQEWQIGHELEQPLSKPQIDPQGSEQNLEIDELAEKAKQKFKEFFDEKLGELEQHSQTCDLLLDHIEKLIGQRRQADADLPLMPTKSLIGQLKQSTDLLREQIKGEFEQPILKQRIVRPSNARGIEEQTKQVRQAGLRLIQHFKEYSRQIEAPKQKLDALIEQCIKQGAPTDMTTMQTEMYDALREAGASEEKARAAAMNVPSIEQVATKEDIATLRTEMIERFGKLENSMLRSMMVIVIGSVGIATAIILHYLPS